MEYPCPCCDFFTLGERGMYEICPVCFWEDDGGNGLDVPSGPNHMTLREGRANFEAVGACDPAMRPHVLPRSLWCRYRRDERPLA